MLGDLVTQESISLTAMPAGEETITFWGGQLQEARCYSRYELQDAVLEDLLGGGGGRDFLDYPCKYLLVPMALPTLEASLFAHLRGASALFRDVRRERPTSASASFGYLVVMELGSGEEIVYRAATELHPADDGQTLLYHWLPDFLRSEDRPGLAWFAPVRSGATLVHALGDPGLEAAALDRARRLSSGDSCPARPMPESPLEGPWRQVVAHHHYAMLLGYIGEMARNIGCEAFAPSKPPRVAKVQDNRQADRAKRRRARGPTERVRERAHEFREIKQKHPDYTYLQVAMEYRRHHRMEYVTGETVRNAYRAMGWRWNGGERTR